MLCQHRRIAAFCVGHERVLELSYDGGFADRGDDRSRLQSQMEDVRPEAGNALCGPNCMEVLSLHHCRSCAIRPGSPAMSSMVSQSRRTLHRPADRRQALGFSHIVSSGTKAVTADGIISTTSSMIRTL
jgi:hypothetical protein